MELNCSVLYVDLDMASTNSLLSLRARDIRIRQQKCWEEEINWDLYPECLTKVHVYAYHAV